MQATRSFLSSIKDRDDVSFITVSGNVTPKVARFAAIDRELAHRQIDYLTTLVHACLGNNGPPSDHVTTQPSYIHSTAVFIA